LTTDMNDLFTPYDDIAVEVISDRTVHDDLRMSNRDMVEAVCQALSVDSFDLFETHDFAAEVERGDKDRCLAYAFIAHLRMQVFNEASIRGTGTPAFSVTAAAHSEFWYMRLVAVWAGQPAQGAISH
jgi:hypothetical protein